MSADLAFDAPIVLHALSEPVHTVGQAVIILQDHCSSSSRSHGSTLC